MNALDLFPLPSSESETDCRRLLDRVDWHLVSDQGANVADAIPAPTEIFLSAHRFARMYARGRKRT